MSEKKRVLALLFAALTIGSVSCGSAAPSGGETTSGAGDMSDTTVEESTRASAAVEGKDYGGKSFDIFVAGNWDNEWTESYDFFSEGETGDVVNDAVYRRNTIIEDRYKVKINEINIRGEASGGNGQGAQTISKGVMSGDTTYDAAMIGTYDVSNLACQGYLLDLNSQVPGLDLTKEWWDQKANEDLSMKGKMYFTTGDISTLDNDCTYCIMFNKKLIDDYNMEDPYEMVRNKTWTMDNFVSMARKVSVDLDGDTKMTENDLYGMCIWQDGVLASINACGGAICRIDDAGQIELTLNNERNIDMLSKFMDLITDRSVAFSLYHSGDHIENMFANDQVLFYNRYLTVVKKYRNMETDFGLLPFPLYDSNQEEYYTTVHVYGNSFVCVPSVVEDVEMTGIILQDMACESMYTVTPAYYDVQLEGKMIRDEESSDMLDIILSTRLYDIGATYQIGGYNEKLMDMFRFNKTDFASMYSKYEAKAQQDIDKVNDAFAEVMNG